MREQTNSVKITDAALSRSIMMSVIGIVLCMVCLLGTTWAWYSLSITSAANDTVGGNFDFSVSIPELSPDEYGFYHRDAEEAPAGPYTVTLTMTGTAAKGFCRVSVPAPDAAENEETENEAPAEPTFVTEYYRIDLTEAGTDKLTFTVEGAGAFKLTPVWGTPADSNSIIEEPLSGAVIDLAALTQPGDDGDDTAAESENTETTDTAAESENTETPGADTDGETKTEQEPEKTAEPEANAEPEAQQEQQDPLPEG